MATGTIMIPHCKQIYTDSTNASFTISQDFKEIEFCVSDTSGTSVPHMQLRFVKGVATRLRNGWFGATNNIAMVDITYDGISTFNVLYYRNGASITPYSNVIVYT